MGYKMIVVLVELLLNWLVTYTVIQLKKKKIEVWTQILAKLIFFFACCVLFSVFTFLNFFLVDLLVAY